MVNRLGCFLFEGFVAEGGSVGQPEQRSKKATLSLSITIQALSKIQRTYIFLKPFLCCLNNNNQTVYN